LQIAHNINGLTLNSVADVLSYATQSQGNTVLDFGNGDTITLMNVSVAELEHDSHGIVLA